MAAIYFKRLLSVLTFVPPFVFIWMLMWLTYYPVRRRLERKRLLEFGKKLGLSYTRPRLRSEFGSFKGSFGGHRVDLQPDEASIHIYSKTKCPGDLIDIASGKCYTNPELHQVDVRLPYPFARSVFGTCRVDRRLVQRWEGAQDFHRALLSFSQTQAWSLKALRINSCLVSAEFNYGYPFHPYLPAEKLRELVENLSTLAQQMDQFVRGFEFRD